MQDYETKVKESEGKRASLLFEFERERTKWDSEKDAWLNQKSEAQLIIAQLEKKKEALTLEVDRLKRERVTRKPLYAGVNNPSTAAYGNPSRYGNFAAGRYKENIQKFSVNEDKQESIETGSNSSSNIKNPLKTSEKGEDENGKPKVKNQTT